MNFAVLSVHAARRSGKFLREITIFFSSRCVFIVIFPRTAKRPVVSNPFLAVVHFFVGAVPTRMNLLNFTVS